MSSISVAVYPSLTNLTWVQPKLPINASSQVHGKKKTTKKTESPNTGVEQVKIQLISVSIFALDIAMIVLKSPVGCWIYFFQVLPELKRCLIPLLDAYPTSGVTTSERSPSHPHLVVFYFHLCSFAGELASCTSALARPPERPPRPRAL